MRRTPLKFLIALFALVCAPIFAPAQPVQTVLFGLTNSWRYNQTVSYDGTNWTAPSFDDSALPVGRGALGVEDAGNAFAIARTNTTLTLGRITYYFRTAFVFTGETSGLSLTFSNVVDDGAVFYLNGQEIQRLYMPTAPAPITYTNLASNHEATTFDVFTISGPLVETNLVQGTNVLAVEVHQTTTNSSDIVFGSALSATILNPNPARLYMPTEPPSFGYRLEPAFPGVSFTDPLAITAPPGETNRLFVVEQAGRIGVITNLAAPNRTPFLDINSRIISGGEEGLLGLAFHPGYSTNGKFYIFYTVTTTSAQGAATRHDRLSEMLVSAANPSLADTNTERVLFEQRDEASNHNGGCLQFGPDGYLYVSLGDEGAGDDTFQNSQRIDKDFFAGMMRLDVDNRPGSVMPNPHPANTNNPAREIRYRIPADNPWIGATTFNGAAVNPASVRTEFYAVGLRNPWRFSFDPATNTLYLSDVGQVAYEEVNIIRRGGNYGWNYREALHAGPRASPPVGVVFDQPIAEYGRALGASVTGGVVSRGDRLPALFGAYIFADYVSGNVWALRANGTNVVPFTRLLGDGGIAGFGADPRNGDVLTADQSDDMLKRLVIDTGVLIGGTLPPTLAHTGAFTNLASLASQTAALTPNPGTRAYDINAPFWSDGARKSRWSFLPGTNKIVFRPDANWSFPTGAAWVKHFDLELTNGVPSSARRLETRVLVKNAAGVYGVTYRWGDSLTNALLVGDEGMDESFTIYDGAGGIVRTQVWHYPGRSECLVCHTPVGGHALGFSTAQLNRDVDYGAGPTNQLAALAAAGYFSGPITNIHSLRSLAPATDETTSLEWRVRSYLAANCAQCHQPGGTGLGFWNSTISNTTANSGLIHGALVNNGGNPAARVIVPGSPADSMLLTRIATRGPGQMPPLATSIVDTQAVALLSQWITSGLTGYQSFAQWQTNNFGSTNAPNALASADPDQDGSGNYEEFVIGTNPNLAGDAWGIGFQRNGGNVDVTWPRLANRSVEIQWTTNLFNPAAWRFLNVPANRPFFPAATGAASASDAVTGGPAKYYRARVVEP